MPAGEITTLPDSALILRVYEKWGEDAPKHLIGDYTFALWDARRRRLLLVRSPLGNRPSIIFTRRAVLLLTSVAVTAARLLAQQGRFILWFEATEIQGSTQ